MSIDAMVVTAIVLLAVAFILRRGWRAIRAARKPASGCGSDCGCDH